MAPLCARSSRRDATACSCGGLLPGWLRVLFLTTMLGVLLGALSPLAAQQPDTVARDTLTPEQRLLERLRALPPAVGGVAAPGDTLPPEDTLPARGRPGRRGESAGITPDSVMRELMALSGYQALTYTADSGVHYAADSARVRLRGPSQLERAGQGMRADSMLVYDLDIERVCGYGQPTFTGPGIEPVTSRQVCFDVQRQLGVAYGGETTYTQGAEWRLWGEELYQQGQSRTYVRDAHFTSCDRTDPHYHFSARRVKMVRDSIMVARDITLRFADVPVFYLPFMAQSMRSGRRSGLLTPVFSVNHVVRTTDRLNRRIDNIGFYWAINENMGAQLAYGWFSNNYSSLHGAFEYRVLRRFLEGSIDARQFWRDGGGTELTLRSRNSWRPDERTQVQASAEYASSSQFVARNTFDPRELSREMSSNASLSRRFDWGSVDVSGVRRQSLSDNEINLTLPRVGVSISPITLFEAPPGQASWYNNATLNGSANFSETRRDIDEALAERGQDQRGREAGLSSTFRLGDLSWRQSFDLTRAEAFEREVAGEDSTVTLGGALQERLSWKSGINYQVRLIGTSTLTPELSLSGHRLRSDSTGMEFVSAPTRLNFGTRLQTDVYGFFPGAGPFERIRHRVSPSLTYNYSPAPDVTELQRQVFGRTVDDIREQNRLTIGLNQTIEAKYTEPEGGEEAAEQAEEARDPDAGPRRLPQGRKLTLLSLQTDAIAYDWVRARQGQGIASEELRNSLSSELLRGLRVSLVHDLFEEGERTGEGDVPRSFSPHLQQVNTSFSFGSDAWLFRFLRLGPSRAGDPEEGEAAAAQRRQEDEEARSDAEAMADDPMARREGTLGMIGERAGRGGGMPGGGVVGSWNASVSYSWTQPRPAELEAGREENQMLQGDLSFTPTPFWTVNWRTGYSITEGAFSDHVVTLTRDLHRWQANFDFVRAQNGNFTFQFRVSLRDNPDLKLDYEQRSDPVTGERRPGF